MAISGPFYSDHEPASHYEVIAALERAYDEQIASGRIQPFVWPSTSLGALVVIVYLLIDHRRSPLLTRLRYLVWLYTVGVAGWCIMYTRARNPAAAFGVGLVSAWGAVWCGVLLVVHDCQKEFSRIVRTEVVVTPDSQSDSDHEQTSEEYDSGVDGVANGNGVSEGLRARGKHEKDVAKPGTKDSTRTSSAQRTTYQWQMYPRDPFIQRLDWTLDLFTTFRGMGWNWRIPGLPSPALAVQHDLRKSGPSDDEPLDTAVSHVGIQRFDCKRALLKHNAYILIRNYFILDVLKTIIVHDPYFWTGNHAFPPRHLPHLILASPFLVSNLRLLVSVTAIFTALQALFALGPLIFACLLGPAVLNVRGEPWMNPDTFGSFSALADKGLAGWWGAWWHQTFRFAFESSGKRLSRALRLDSAPDPHEKPTTPLVKFVRLAAAFVLSAILHASGSCTQLGRTSPLSGPFLFFLLQIVGIAGQMAASAGLAQAGISTACPRWVRRVSSLGYVYLYMHLTAPLLVDDFARGGVWLFEPIPFSLLRGPLGLGVAGDRAFMWWGDVVRWHSGERWWQSGLAL